MCRLSFSWRRSVTWAYSSTIPENILLLFLIDEAVQNYRKYSDGKGNMHKATASEYSYRCGCLHKSDQDRVAFFRTRHTSHQTFPIVRSEKRRARKFSFWSGKQKTLAPKRKNSHATFSENTRHNQIICGSYFRQNWSGLKRKFKLVMLHGLFFVLLGKRNPNTTSRYNLTQ